MKNELYELYRQCFPGSLLSKDNFLRLVDYDHSKIIMEEEHCHMIGAAVINADDILLLCVLPKKQKMGYGKKLLLRSEEIIQNTGYKHVHLGRKFDELIDNQKQKDINTGFFEQFHYKVKDEQNKKWAAEKELAPNKELICP